jgi:hypothetical protein
MTIKLRYTVGTAVGLGGYMLVSLSAPFAKQATHTDPMPLGAVPAFSVPASGAMSAGVVVKPNTLADETILMPVWSGWGMHNGAASG